MSKVIMEKINVGDLISAYHKGWHIVTAVEPRSGDEALITYRTVVTTSFKKVKSTATKKCSVFWCYKWTMEEIEEFRKKEIEKINQGCDLLLDSANF